jgi:hypothetical protein
VTRAARDQSLASSSSSAAAAATPSMRRRPNSARPSRDLGGLAGAEAVGIIEMFDGPVAQRFIALLERDVGLLEQDVEYVRELIDIAMDSPVGVFVAAAAKTPAAQQISSPERGRGELGRQRQEQPEHHELGLAEQQQQHPELPEQQPDIHDQNLPPRPLTAREVRETADELRAALERVDVEDVHNSLLTRSPAAAGMVTKHASSPKRTSGSTSSSLSSSSTTSLLASAPLPPSSRIKAAPIQPLQPAGKPLPPTARSRSASRPVSGGTSYRESGGGTATDTSGPTTAMLPQNPPHSAALPTAASAGILAPVPPLPLKIPRGGSSARRLRETVRSSRTGSDERA